jgi:hypothetical protein
VAFDHDGATWVVRRGVASWLRGLAFGVSALLALVVWAVTSMRWLTAAPIAAAWVGLVVALWRVTRPEVVRITVRDLAWPEGRVRVDDISRTSVDLAVGERWCLVVETVRGAKHLVAIVDDKADVDRFRGLVEEARTTDARRRSASGREWSFLRRAPDALARLRDRG